MIGNARAMAANLNELTPDLVSHSSKPWAGDMWDDRRDEHRGSLRQQAKATWEGCPRVSKGDLDYVLKTSE